MKFNNPSKSLKNFQIAIAIFAISSSLFAADKTESSKAAEHAPSGHTSHWGYTGKTGPAYWGKLSPEYAVADYGRRQSPIDLGQKEIAANVRTPRAIYRKVPLEILNNGHTIQANCPHAGAMHTNGKAYQVLQVHFHSPSEHTVDGVRYPLEAHLVHKNKDGELAVLGVLFTEGTPNEVLDVIFGNAPQPGKTIKVEGADLDLDGLLPSDRSIWRYNGSLTTPPCTEGVLWSVIREPETASQRQIEGFKSMYNGNTRPIQPINDRFVLVDIMVD